jgi:hypothetical protein
VKRGASVLSPLILSAAPRQIGFSAIFQFVKLSSIYSQLFIKMRGISTLLSVLHYVDQMNDNLPRFIVQGRTLFGQFVIRDLATDQAAKDADEVILHFVDRHDAERCAAALNCQRPPVLPFAREGF